MICFRYDLDILTTHIFKKKVFQYGHLDDKRGLIVTTTPHYKISPYGRNDSSVGA